MNSQTKHLVDKCDQFIRFSYCALIYFLPISVALTESFAGFILFFFFLKRGFLAREKLQNISPKKSPGLLWKRIKISAESVYPVPSDLNRPIGAFILAGFISILISQNPFLSVKGFFFKLLESTYLCFIFIEVFTAWKNIKFFLGSFVVSGL